MYENALNFNSRRQCVVCPRWYFNPFKFLYRFPHTSQRYGLSFSMPAPSGYGVLDLGSMMEKVPSSFSFNVWFWWPCNLW